MMNVFPPLSKHADSVMAIQNGSFRPDLQGPWLTGSQREFQLAGQEEAKSFEFGSI